MIDNGNTFNLFNKIWEDVVIPLSNEISNKYGLHSCNSRAKYIAKHRYYKESQIFVQSYMVDKTRNIDRHKIASCMMKSILLAKPLKMSFRKKFLYVFGKLNISDKARLANQYLALSVAITILEGYIQSDKKKQIKHKIYFPEPFPEEDNCYLNDICLDLYYTRARDINTITYSNVFFLLEKYSCRKVQCENLAANFYECLKNPTKYLNDNCISEDKIDEHISKVKFQERVS